ncbi:polyprenyl synthetase family protein [Paradesulfitobacterium ferrireducens]|uniref:polyprenyl synthetase family protein n=1 Tax=Paradesulfitobacterium ferrireducens TaxID=2816476 RepID=UPI001A8E22AE|nr:farnesyl diphosphate synthase [Paradesulfitobacterium ferrireducens]
MFVDQYRSYQEMIENYLENLPWGEGILSESMCYSLLGGGKRIRPVLALASGAALGGKSEDFLPAACALEMIHTYSLIHDDLPAMDDDDYRRGKLTNHKVFGEGIAVLAGDALLTYAFELLAEPLPIAPERQLRVLREVAAAAGKSGMVFGQVQDLAGEDRSLTLEEIEQIHRDKTGALLVASARLGAILAGGSEPELEAFTLYAQALGLAFQIKDDILDIEGDSKLLGKTVGSDLRRHKATYPSLLGLEGAKEHLHKQIAKAKQSLKGLGPNAAFLNGFADYIEQRQH